MYDWKTLKTLGLFLLCLPLLHLGFLAWATHEDLQNPDPAVWQEQLQEIIDGDQSLSLPSAPIVLTGGLSARLWRDLPAAISERPTLLHCVSLYPTPAPIANLSAIDTMRARYALPIGEFEIEVFDTDGRHLKTIERYFMIFERPAPGETPEPQGPIQKRSTEISEGGLIRRSRIKNYFPPIKPGGKYPRKKRKNAPA